MWMYGQAKQTVEIKLSSHSNSNTVRRFYRDKVNSKQFGVYAWIE
jgi:hypothetical protein